MTRVKLNLNALEVACDKWTEYIGSTPLIAIEATIQAYLKVADLAPRSEDDKELREERNEACDQMAELREALIGISNVGSGHTQQIALEALRANDALEDKK